MWEKITTKTIKWTGSTSGIIWALALMVAWCVYGFFDNWSDHSQLILSSVTSIITFIMLFLIQKGQNKADKATQLKLDELLFKNELTDNSHVGVEELSEADIDRMKAELKECK